MNSGNVTVANGSESHDYDIILLETIYGGTVDAVTGEGKKTWELVEFDGTEDWRIYTGNFPSENTSKFTLNSLDSVGGNLISVSDRFRNVQSAWALDESWIFADSNNTAFSTKYFNLPKSNVPDLDSWKSYLAAQAAAGTPVQVAYKLATPEPFQATGNQALPAVAGLNTVYTDGDSLSVTGRQDLLYTLQTMQAPTTNLNRFIAERGTQ